MVSFYPLLLGILATHGLQETTLKWCVNDKVVGYANRDDLHSILMFAKKVDILKATAKGSVPDSLDSLGEIKTLNEDCWVVADCTIKYSQEGWKFEPERPSSFLHEIDRNREAIEGVEEALETKGICMYILSSLCNKVEGEFKLGNILVKDDTCKETRYYSITAAVGRAEPLSSNLVNSQQKNEILIAILNSIKPTDSDMIP